MMKKRIELDSYENEIEAQGSAYIPVTGIKRTRIETILEKGRKTKNINIRISENDLNRLKRRSMEEGIPYQTLISSILHKYVSNKLVDEKEILKSIELLGNRD
jgi:predicted DNA binding CopG/RHH family protein